MKNAFRADDLHAYARRGWAEARDLKRRAWAADAIEAGPDGGLAVSDQLWRHARSVDPSWPDAATRAKDLEHHRHLQALLLRLRNVELSR